MKSTRSGLQKVNFSIEKELNELKQKYASTQVELGKTKHELGETKHELGETKHELGETKHELGETKHELGKTKHELGETQQKLAYAEERLAWFNRQVFGTKSERLVRDLDVVQLEFEGFTVLPTQEAEKKQVAAHTRKTPERKGHDAIKIPDNLPVERIVLDLSEKEKICKETGVALVKIGEEVSRKLAVHPGSYFIKEYVRPKYAHPKREEKGILIRPMLCGILPKCRVDESLLADIFVKKFGDHTPLNRIAEIYQRQDIFISTKLMSQWVLKVAQALRSLYELILKKILEGDQLFVDETPVKVFEKEKCRLGYMWTLVGGPSGDSPYHFYEFRKTHEYSHAYDLLKGYQKIIHSDKYGGYLKLAQSGQITWCPCWAHVRRKFFDAESDPKFRDWILARIGDLFDLEQIAWSVSAEERLAIRKEQEEPILDEILAVIKAKLTTGHALPKSKLREALNYAYSLSPYLKNYLNHPYARLDNNTAERSLRAVAVGRKNWLFFGSDDGADAGAIFLSLIQSCRHLKINPQLYLEDVMRRIMSHVYIHLDELLPDRWQLAREAEGIYDRQVSPLSKP